jgi:hypothetical protein
VDEPTSKDLIDGDRVFALQALNKYQAQTKAWRDHTVISREFNKGDIVLVRTARTESRGKLEPKWEGPFIVKTKASPSACRLTTQSGEDLEHRQPSQIFCLTPQGQLALVIPQTVLFRPALFSSRGVRFLMRRSHVIYMQKIPRKKNYVEKRPHRQSSAFDNHEVTARGSASYPRVRHSTQKSPKGAARLAQQVRKTEVFLKRLSLQKLPKGAAGLAQQVRKTEVFLNRLSVQKSPKGAAGLAQQVCKIEVFLRRLSVQKSPKGIAGLAQ